MNDSPCHHEFHHEIIQSVVGSNREEIYFLPNGLWINISQVLLVESVSKNDEESGDRIEYLRIHFLNGKETILDGEAARAFINALDDWADDHPIANVYRVQSGLILDKK